MLSFVSQLGWRLPSRGGWRGLPRLLGNTSPGLWTGRSRAGVTNCIQFFRHPGHYHFFIIFPTPFYIDVCSILAANLVPKSLQNPLKIAPESDLENNQHFSQILHRFFYGFGTAQNLKSSAPVEAGS